MQVITTKCPYCHHEVDSTTDHLDGPVVCPSCHKPFEMEMPTAVVTSVREVDQNSADENRMATEPQELTLARVHPVVFRAHPFSSLLLACVALIALAGLVMSIAGMTVAGVALGETRMLGPASLATWLCATVLLVVAGIVGYWKVLSQCTTLTVTDDRTIYQAGLIARETSEVQHDDVRNIQLDQTFAQRLLNIGGIGISSSGQDDLEIVATQLPHPKRIIDLIRENQE
ncbi:PH domain-containing protein [Lignipirellula cremea]|uniref:Bacterial membrane flanked domain protein n=1 Tax=Lignipirellula cremea TaxID=2528010 RepID=A0A518DPK1_9BACT|nr:PH domain-containing protein [Lignipirellula cremea]QDU93743.1 Bacterial membrane flanked domain protein [Lignipirellula cremea]